MIAILRVIDSSPDIYLTLDADNKILIDANKEIYEGVIKCLKKY